MTQADRQLKMDRTGHNSLLLPSPTLQPLLQEVLVVTVRSATHGQYGGNGRSVADPHILRGNAIPDVCLHRLQSSIHHSLVAGVPRGVGEISELQL